MAEGIEPEPGGQGWDYEFDVIVVGSGAAGMTSTVIAADLGLAPWSSSDRLKAVKTAPRQP